MQLSNILPSLISSTFRRNCNFFILLRLKHIYSLLPAELALEPVSLFCVSCTQLASPAWFHQFQVMEVMKEIEYGQLLLDENMIRLRDIN